MCGAKVRGTAAPRRLGWLGSVPSPPPAPGRAGPRGRRALPAPLPQLARAAGLTRGSALQQMRHAPASFQCEWIEWSSHVAATVCKSPRLLCCSPAAAPCTWPLLRSHRRGLLRAEVPAPPSLLLPALLPGALCPAEIAVPGLGRGVGAVGWANRLPRGEGSLWYPSNPGSVGGHGWKTTSELHAGCFVQLAGREGCRSRRPPKEEPVESCMKPGLLLAPAQDSQ